MHLADGFLAANTQLQEMYVRLNLQVWTTPSSLTMCRGGMLWTGSSTLANLALRAISRGSLPTSSVTDLTLANCLLSTTYPRDLASMAALIRLYVSLSLVASGCVSPSNATASCADRDLSQNLFTDFPSSLSLPMLQELNLSSNELSSFRGDLPLLESLCVLIPLSLSLSSSIELRV
jgi:hypothetical protein